MERVDFSCVILAAGKGTRMRSPLPKVLHPVAGLPMLQRVIAAARAAGSQDTRVVVGHGQDLVRRLIEPLGAVAHVQKEQLGTGDAVRAADPESLSGIVVILNGDHPLIRASDIRELLQAHLKSQNMLSVVSARVRRPGSYGRILRQGDRLMGIVEAKDASAEQLQINEVNTGIYLVDSETLRSTLKEVSNQNAQTEYYLTDIVRICLERGQAVGAIVGSRHLAVGVNSQAELAKATRLAFARKANDLMESGVVLIDPGSTRVEESVEIGEASVLYPNVFIKGNTRLGRFCVVESHSFLRDAVVGESTQIKAGSYIEESQIGARCAIGPYAHLRPGNEVGDDCKIGNFVELKKVLMGQGVKASHLTYLGDAEIGAETNIGCGTITCNYAADHKKYRTKIGRGVFVGSDTQFIAPVIIGDQAVIGSGSTITKDVPARALAVARGRQIIKEGYVAEKELPAAKE